MEKSVIRLFGHPWQLTESENITIRTYMVIDNKFITNFEEKQYKMSP